MTLGRTPLDEGWLVTETSTCMTQNIHEIKTSMPPAEFEPSMRATADLRSLDDFTDGKCGDLAVYVLEN